MKTIFVVDVAISCKHDYANYFENEGYATAKL